MFQVHIENYENLHEHDPQKTVIFVLRWLADKLEENNDWKAGRLVIWGRDVGFFQQVNNPKRTD